jgi:hypothetical protein
VYGVDPLDENRETDERAKLLAGVALAWLGSDADEDGDVEPCEPHVE